MVFWLFRRLVISLFIPYLWRHSAATIGPTSPVSPGDNDPTSVPATGALPSRVGTNHTGIAPREGTHRVSHSGR